MIQYIRKTGIYTKGIVYFLIGMLTLLAVLNLGGDVSGKNGVINFLENQMFGKVLIAVIGLGLILYAVWRLSSAFMDKKDKGNDEEGILKRIGYFFSGLIYASIGLSAFLSSFGGSNGNSSDTKESLASMVLNQSWGQIALFLLALILLGVGIYQFYKGYDNKFMEEIDQRSDIDSRELLEKTGKTGHFARGISFWVFAFFVAKAAMYENPDEIKGLEGVFKFIQDMTMGNILLALMAIGFMAYGVFQYFHARHSNLSES